MINRYKNLTASIFLVAVVAAVFWPLLNGKALLHTGLIYNDLWLFNYPIKDWYRGLLMQGQLPFWTSLIGNGYPMLAEGQMGALYPWHLLLFRFFPTLLAFNLNLMLHFLLAGIFTFWFSHISLKMSVRAALLSAFAFIFSGYFVLHIHQINIIMVITYLPLSLFLAEKLAKHKMHYLPLMAVTFVMQILAGNIEMFYYSLLITFLYLVLQIIFSPPAESQTGKKNYLPVFGALALALILAIGITWVQLTATYELNKYSQRATGLDLEEAQSSRWPVKTLLFFINPRYLPIYKLDEQYNAVTARDAAVTEVYAYIGFIPLLLALAAILFNRKKYSLIFTLMLLFALIYAFGRSTQLFTLLWETLPGLKFFRYPTKIVFFIDLALAILAGLGWDYFAQKFSPRFKNSKIFNYGSWLVLAACVADLLVFNVFGTLNLVNGRDWLAIPPAAKLLQEKIEPAYNYRFYSHGTNNLDYNSARNLPMQKGLQNILARDFNMIYQLPNNREWVALFLNRQTQLNGPVTSIDIEKRQLTLPKILENSLAVQAVKYLISDIPLANQNLQEIAKFPLPASLDHLFYLRGAAGTETVRIPTDHIYLYETDFYLPRTYFVNDYQTVKDDEAILKQVFNREFDPREKVLLEEEVEFSPIPDTKADASTTVVADRQNAIEIAVEAKTSGFLVVADTYYPGWRAWVDGSETKIFRANYGFRAVQVPEGGHRVTMGYVPTGWQKNMFISLASLAGLVAVTAGIFIYAFVRGRRNI